MVEKPQRLYSARDAVNSRALRELSEAIEAVPIRSLKVTKGQGNVYLVKFHESTSSCFIARLPPNLVRSLISYNSIAELIALSLTCRQFSKFLFDKYLSFSGFTPEIGFYSSTTFSFQDYYDLLRISELTGGSRKVKVYGSVRPELTSIFYVNSRVDQFYSYFEGTIMEGTFVKYCDEMRIVSSRPCIQGVVVTDVCGDMIACASSTEIALSLTSSELRVARFKAEETPLAIKFIAGKRMLLVQKNTEFEVYLLTLHRTCVTRHEGALQKLNIPDPAKSTFATMSPHAITSYSVSGIGEIHQQFQRKRKLLELIPSDFIMHRVVAGEHHYDFLFLLIEGRLLMNGEPLEHGGLSWDRIQLVDGRLFAGNSKSIVVFTFHKALHTFHFASKVDLYPNFSDPDDPSAVILYFRMKLVCAYLFESNYFVTYYSLDQHNHVSQFASVSLPYIDRISIQMMRQATIVKGFIQVEHNDESWFVQCVFVVDFNTNSMLTNGPGVERQALELVERRAEELAVKKMKKMQLKKLEKEEKAKKKEEMQSKHKPRN